MTLVFNRLTWLLTRLEYQALTGVVATLYEFLQLEVSLQRLRQFSFSHDTTAMPCIDLKRGLSVLTEVYGNNCIGCFCFIKHAHYALESLAVCSMALGKY